MFKHIKIFGLQRTCTTFVRSLCKNNFKKVKLYTNQFGSKHTVPRDVDYCRKWISTKYENKPKKAETYRKILKEMLDGNFLNSIVVIKNPYSWYYSIKKWRNKKFNFKKEYKKYNRLYSIYKDFHLNKSEYGNFYGESCIIRYEDILKDTDKVMRMLCEAFDVELKHNSIKIPVKVQQSETFTNERKKFYLSDGVFGLSKAQVDVINGILDWNLMRFYGYEKRIIK